MPETVVASTASVVEVEADVVVAGATVVATGTVVCGIVTVLAADANVVVNGVDAIGVSAFFVSTHSNYCGSRDGCATALRNVARRTAEAAAEHVAAGVLVLTDG